MTAQENKSMEKMAMVPRHRTQSLDDDWTNGQTQASVGGQAYQQGFEAGLQAAQQQSQSSITSVLGGPAIGRSHGQGSLSMGYGIAGPNGHANLNSPQLDFSKMTRSASVPNTQMELAAQQNFGQLSQQAQQQQNQSQMGAGFTKQSESELEL